MTKETLKREIKKDTENETKTTVRRETRERRPSKKYYNYYVHLTYKEAHKRRRFSKMEKGHRRRKEFLKIK